MPVADNKWPMADSPEAARLATAYTLTGMSRSDHLSISQIAELLAHKGYEVAETGDGMLRVRDLETCISMQTVLEGNVLYLSVNLTTVPDAEITSEIMRKMLSSDNGISTSSFQLYDVGEGKTAITLNNFCTIQNMGEEDQDDILSSAGYLRADVLAARDLLQGSAAAH
jgi:hypothetical protein